MKKFEYNLLRVEESWLGGIKSDEALANLNSLGAQGWEIVSVIDNVSRPGPLLILLKRETM